MRKPRLKAKQFPQGFTVAQPRFKQDLFAAKTVLLTPMLECLYTYIIPGPIFKFVRKTLKYVPTLLRN